jgi:hypothetical protein
MSNEILTLNQQNVRGTDSNSLLRLYDQANDIFTKSPSQMERIRAGKAVERISKELQRRKVSL